MKSSIKIFSVAFSLLLMSCTDVIEVNVPEAPPRLVIEASMDWQKGTLGNSQTVKLSLSTPYFDNLIESPVTGASVKVINNESQAEVIFTDSNNGNYITDSFDPVMGDSYTLMVNYDGDLYLATETMTSVSPISDVFQSTENGFNKDALEVNIEFFDPAGEENFYLSKFQRRGDKFQTLFDLKDEFTDGNKMSIFYEKLENEDSGETEFQPGDIVDIELLGLSDRYYNYIKLLIEQSQSGGPFSAIPAEIKGNCINQTHPENYAFGYFRVSEVDKRVYIFE